jgi:hypothetical protein
MDCLVETLVGRILEAEPGVLLSYLSLMIAKGMPLTEQRF